MVDDMQMLLSASGSAYSTVSCLGPGVRIGLLLLPALTFATPFSALTISPVP
jgi:hypothetical protein